MNKETLLDKAEFAAAMAPSVIPQTDDHEFLWQWLDETLLRNCNIKGVFYLTYPSLDSDGTPETLILKSVWKTSYPEDYMNALPGNPLTNDYSANFVLKGGGLSRWHNPESLEKMTKGEQARIKFDEKYNMGVGCCFPIYALGRAICGGFGLRSNSQDPVEFDKMLDTHQEALGKFLLAFDAQYRSPYARDMFKLSAQEVRVLGYLTGGMAVGRVAHKMELSVKTIESYMATIRKKTSSSTTGQMIGRGVFFNLV
jgi:DNA-binding CsgD family transcriptional regulator